MRRWVTYKDTRRAYLSGSRHAVCALLVVCFAQGALAAPAVVLSGDVDARDEIVEGVAVGDPARLGSAVTVAGTRRANCLDRDRWAELE